MPDRSKYPSGFDPYHFHHPGAWAHPPSEELETAEDLTSEETSYDILLCLADIRQDYPTATHIYVEKDGDDGIKVTTQHRTQHPNPNYAVEMARYQALKAEHDQAKAAWEANSQRWKAEAEAEKNTADYKVYLGLKARFEGR